MKRKSDIFKVELLGQKKNVEIPTEDFSVFCFQKENSSTKPFGSKDQGLKIFEGL